MNCINKYESLMSRCVEVNVNYFENIFNHVYSWRLSKINKRDKANFGPFSGAAPPILMLIIEELIRRKKCSYEYLRVLLPKEATNLTCDEDQDYSPFDQNTLKLIRKRCPNFKSLHLHIKFTQNEVEEIKNFNKLLRKSLLKHSELKELNLYGCSLEVDTLTCISKYCPKLKKLNLHHTNITHECLSSLFRRNSVMRRSLRKLIIDAIDLSDHSIKMCLLHFPRLKYFLSDRTLLATRELFDESRSRSENSETDPVFRTRIIKNKFVNCDILSMNVEFLNWVIERFPKVDHLILISIRETCTSFVNGLITSWKNITHLELNSIFRRGFNSFDRLKESFEFCATNSKLKYLKLESFVNVDLSFLGRKLKSLEKLSLINNTYIGDAQSELFENLLEVEIILSKYDLTNSIAENIFAEHMSYEGLYSVLTAKKLEKVYIHNQWNFIYGFLNEFIRGKHLQNLKELMVFYCPIRIDCIKELFIHKIPIENIVVGLCPLIRVNDVEKLSDYIRINNLKASITLASQIPYRLRWTILNIPDAI